MASDAVTEIKDIEEWFVSVAGRITAPKDVHVPIPRNHDYVTLYGKKCFCRHDDVKGLEIGDYSGDYSSRSSVITKVF